MRKALREGFLDATEIADYLAAKGVPFRDAHHVAGRLVGTAVRAGKVLAELTLARAAARSTPPSSRTSSRRSIRRPSSSVATSTAGRRARRCSRSSTNSTHAWRRSLAAASPRAASGMLPAMTDLLESLHAPLLEEVAGLELSSEGLRGQLDLRYGLLTFQIDHDEEAEAAARERAPAPARGRGSRVPDLVSLARTRSRGRPSSASTTAAICWSMPTCPPPPTATSSVLRDDVIDCIDSIAELIDDGLCAYLLEHRLGTPAQLERWSSDSD